jgi:predicted MFS family arabinose efflux permease
MSSNESVSIRNYALVTAAYWAFTLTDGALRMLVLLHFHELGYSPLQLATLFLLYELLGCVTNLVGGLVAARIGLKVTLVGGLLLQVFALGMLSLLDATWSMTAQVVHILLAQGLSGVAKDLTKLSAKTAIKLVLPENASGTLFRWVALLTGSKNALKGVGFFLGGALLVRFGFQGSLYAMAGVVVVSWLITQWALPSDLGRPEAKLKVRQLLSKTRAVNLMAAARVFLFGARDVWFVVALPIYFSSVLGWTFVEVSTFMALWVIGYGGVQSLAPRLLQRRHEQEDSTAAFWWAALLAAVPVAIVALLEAGFSRTVVLVAGLAVFGAVFAVNSSLHSYLILAYSARDKAAANVGFYYMANAGGRLLGTFLSGWVYQVWGLSACLGAAAAMLTLAAVFTARLPAVGHDEPRPAQ